MNKLTSFFILLFIFAVSINLQAQVDKLQIVKANGEIVNNGTELLSFNYGAAGKNLLTDSLLVRNIGEETLRIKVRKNEVSIVSGTFNTFHALAQELSPTEYVTPNVWELASNETLPLEAYFQGAYFLQNQFGTSTFLYSFLTLDNNNVVLDSVYVTYHFINNSVTPLNLENQVFINKEVMVTGDPIEEVSFLVKLFNHNADSIAMRVEKEVLYMEGDHEVYFSFGGEEYDSSFDFSSEEGYYIQSMDTLTGENGFTALFNANGIDGNTELTKVNYTFFNRDEESDKSVITLVFNPSAVGFSEFEDYDISSVYPNPTSDLFSIKHHLPSGLTTVLKVYNSSGALMTAKTINNQQLESTFSIRDWNAGVYYLSIEIDGKPIGTEKIIKK